MFLCLFEFSSIVGFFDFFFDFFGFVFGSVFFDWSGCVFNQFFCFFQIQIGYFVYCFDYVDFFVVEIGQNYVEFSLFFGGVISVIISGCGSSGNGGGGGYVEFFFYGFDQFNEVYNIYISYCVEDIFFGNGYF